MAQANNGTIAIDIPPHLPRLVAQTLSDLILFLPVRYSTRTLLVGLADSGYYFVHVWPGGENKNLAYNSELKGSNLTPLEQSPAITLRDGTKVVFPLDLDESDSSEESIDPPEYDSDGNVIRIRLPPDRDESESSVDLINPLEYDSDGNE